MSAHLSDQAVELLMYMSTGAMARAGAKRFPALAQHFGIKPDAPPAEQSMSLVPVVPPEDVSPGVSNMTDVSFGEPEVRRNIQADPMDSGRRVVADTLDASNRALVGRVPGSLRSPTRSRDLELIGATAPATNPPHRFHKESQKVLDDLLLPARGNTVESLRQELHPNTEAVFKHHSWIPGGQDEIPDENV